MDGFYATIISLILLSSGALAVNFLIEDSGVEPQITYYNGSIVEIENLKGSEEVLLKQDINNSDYKAVLNREVFNTSGEFNLSDYVVFDGYNLTVQVGNIKNQKIQVQGLRSKEDLKSYNITELAKYTRNIQKRSPACNIVQESSNNSEDNAVEFTAFNWEEVSDDKPDDFTPPNIQFEIVNSSSIYNSYSEEFSQPEEDKAVKSIVINPKDATGFSIIKDKKTPLIGLNDICAGSQTTTAVMDPYSSTFNLVAKKNDKKYNIEKINFTK